MKNLNESDISRVIEMAWEDRTPFEAIEKQFKIKENQLNNLTSTVYLIFDILQLGILFFFNGE